MSGDEETRPLDNKPEIRPCIKKTTEKGSPEKARDDGEDLDVDGGWAWIVLCANCLANAINSSLFYTFGMYYVELLEEFKASRSVTAWVGSLNNSIFMLAGPLATMIMNRVGNRVTIILAGIVACIGYVLSSFAPNLETLFLTYGLIAAFGSCLNYTGWVITLGTYFKKKYAVAFSVAQMGVGIGMFTLGPLFKTFITDYGWRGSYLISGAVALNLSVCGSLVFPQRGARNLKQRGVPSDSETGKELLKTESKTDEVYDKLTMHSMMRDSRAWFLNISCFFWLMATMIVYVLMQDFSYSRRLQDYYMYTFSAMGVGDLLGRLSIGPIIQKFQLNSVLVSMVSQFACTLAILSFLVIFDGYQMAAQAFVFSITYGVQCVGLALVPAHIFGQDNLSLIFGFNMFFCGAGTLCGPPIAGLIVDLTGSYDGAIGFAAVCELLSAGASVLCFVCYKRQLRGKLQIADM